MGILGAFDDMGVPYFAVAVSRGGWYPGRKGPPGNRLIGWMLLALSAVVWPFSAYAANVGPVVLSDAALDAVHARGLYFRMDMSIEVYNPGDTVPQVTVNTSNPISVPTSTINTSTTPTSTNTSTSPGGTTSTSSFGSPGGSVALSGNAQSAVSSLVNVVGAGSVINVGVNVVNITNSSSDTLYTTNTNLGLMGGANTSIPASSLNTSSSPSATP